MRKQKNNYNVLKSYLIDKNTVSRFEEIYNSNKINIPDTIIINSIAISNRTIERYMFIERNNNQQVTSFWINCKEKIILSDNDLNNIKTQISKSDNNETFNNKKLTFNNFKVLNSSEVSGICWN